jgi:hypothetical protein
MSDPKRRDEGGWMPPEEEWLIDTAEDFDWPEFEDEVRP